MTGTDAACLHTNQSRSYLNHLVLFGTDDLGDRHSALYLLASGS